MSTRTSPTVVRRRLAAELRELRRRSNLNRKQVAEAVGIAESTVTKIENNSTAPAFSVVSLMLDLYEVEGEQRQFLLTLAREVRKRGWWQSYKGKGAIPEWFEVYVGMESAASKLNHYDSELIPRDRRRNNGGVIVNVFYMHSRIKQYLKDGRAMRIETVVNAPRDLGCNTRLPNLEELQAKARAANRRMREIELAGLGCVLASPAFERIAHPAVDTAGRRTRGLRFGDPRVKALYQTLPAVTGFTNKTFAS